MTRRPSKKKNSFKPRLRSKTFLSTRVVHRAVKRESKPFVLYSKARREKFPFSRSDLSCCSTHKSQARARREQPIYFFPGHLTTCVAKNEEHHASNYESSKARFFSFEASKPSSIEIFQARKIWNSYALYFSHSCTSLGVRVRYTKKRSECQEFPNIGL